ncbi:hypothetical protein J6590_059304 [Homalodisca vitripennis]|nr:hypothetical protein J6590_073961 [Homalodisca vitripennis]KAG8242789.1 hypothetical protein J6590_059304 [Homalodisca vitripennis]
MYSLTKHLGSEHPLRKSYRDLKRQFRTSIHSAKSGLVFNHITRPRIKTRLFGKSLETLSLTKNVHKSFTNFSINNESGSLMVDPLEISCQFNSFFSGIGNRLRGSSLEPRGMSHVMWTVVPSLFLKPTSVQE